VQLGPGDFRTLCTDRNTRFEMGKVADRAGLSRDVAVKHGTESRELGGA